jgi:hypothetical protein
MLTESIDSEYKYPTSECIFKSTTYDLINQNFTNKNKMIFSRYTLNLCPYK